MKKTIIGSVLGFLTGSALLVWAVGPVPFDVINFNTGFRYSGSAASGEYARGDGTNFVSSAIQVGDLPAGHVDALTDLDGSLCGTNEILEDQGAAWACIATPTGGGYDTVQDDGTGLTQRDTLNFTGTGVSCADDTTKTTCTISGSASPLTTKGDIFTFDTGDARLPVGTDGHVLTADSGEATGIKWAAAAGGGSAQWMGSGAFFSATGTRYGTLYSFGGVSADESQRHSRAPIAGTISDLRVNADAPSSGQSTSITLRKGGADTAMTCTISNTATSCQDLSNDVTVAVGDLMAFKFILSASSATQNLNLTFTFTPS